MHCLPASVVDVFSQPPSLSNLALLELDLVVTAQTLSWIA